MNHFLSVGPKLSNAQIEALEEQLAASLPADYREFLLRTNGGVPEKACFHVEGRDELCEPWVDAFLALDSNLASPVKKTNTRTIAFWTERYGSYIPDGTLIIGIVGRDDPLLLYYRGARRGHVWWKSLEQLPFPPDRRWKDERELGMYPVAHSFSEFLDMLHYAVNDPRSVDRQAAADQRRNKRRQNGI